MKFNDETLLRFSGNINVKNAFFLSNVTFEKFHYGTHRSNRRNVHTENRHIITTWYTLNGYHRLNARLEMKIRLAFQDENGDMTHALYSSATVGYTLVYCVHRNRFVR